MSIESRHACVQIIDSMIQDAEEGRSVWSNKENIRKLLWFASLDDLPKVRACYMVAKHYPGVLVGQDLASQSLEVEAAQMKQKEMFKEFQAAAFKPKELMEEYNARRSCPITQNKLFDHMTNHAARSHWKFKSRPMEPSSWLDVCITGEQNALSVLQILRGGQFFRKSWAREQRKTSEKTH